MNKTYKNAYRSHYFVVSVFFIVEGRMVAYSFYLSHYRHFVSFVDVHVLMIIFNCSKKIQIENSYLVIEEDLTKVETGVKLSKKVMYGLNPFVGVCIFLEIKKVELLTSDLTETHISDYNYCYSEFRQKKKKKKTVCVYNPVSHFYKILSPGRNQANNRCLTRSRESDQSPCHESTTKPTNLQHTKM